MTSELKRLLAMACLLAAAAAGADEGGLLEGELGRWLDGVAPELGETLARHPRFKGETVRLVAVSPGVDDGGSNRLADAVERRLRQRLLEVEDVRLAAETPRRACEPPRQIGYLVRIEVTPAGRREARVHIAVVDVAESLWVSGISHRWQGRLSSAERRALAAPVAAGIAGSAGSPIPLDRAEAVAAALIADLGCTLPRDLSGAVFVATPDSPALARVGTALHTDLMFEPLAAVTPDREEARWLLQLDAAEAGSDLPDVRELALTLSSVDGGSRQRVASVFVAGTAVTDAVAAPAEPPAVSLEPPPRVVVDRAPAPALLSQLTLQPAVPEGICDDRKARMNSCVEVAFELEESAYLFVISTRDHRISEAPCEGSLRRAEPGARRYRLRLPPGSFAVDPDDQGPDAGFYVLAVRQRHVAEDVRRALAEAPGACAGEAPAAGRDWLDGLGRVLERHGETVSWRALHLVHDTQGIVAL